MTIYDLRKTKAGFTLVEMVITLVILSILMTSSLGMIVSSNSLFISTSKAALDKRVGNGIFDLLTDIMRYSTHLSIYDTDADVDGSSSQVFTVNVTDEDTDSGVIQYKSETGSEVMNLYDSSYYGGRTVQYKIEKVGNSNNHIRITLTVIRDGKSVYTRSEIIKCVNLSLITSGSNKNTIVDKSTAGTYNQKLVFVSDEQLVTGGEDAYSLEYKISEYLAKYNSIQKCYAADLNKALGLLTGNYDATTNSGIKGTKNATGARMKDSIYADKINKYYRIIFGNDTEDKNGTWEYNGDDITKCVNLRAYYQEQIEELLTFMPTAAGYTQGACTTTKTQAKNGTKNADGTVKTLSYSSHTGDAYYGVVATKEEIYTGFMLKYYDENKDGKITQAEFPSFSNPDTFFSGTSIASYLEQTSKKNTNKMVILGYCVDNVTDDNDDTTNLEYKQQLQKTTTETVYATDGASATALAIVEGFTISDTSTYNSTSAGYIVRTVNSGTTASDGNFATFKMHNNVNYFNYYKYGTGSKADFSYWVGIVKANRTYDFTSISQTIKYNNITYAYSQCNLKNHTSCTDKSFEENGHYTDVASQIGSLKYDQAKDDLKTRLSSNGVTLTAIDKYCSVSPSSATTNDANNPKTLTFTANQNLTEGVYYYHLKYNHTNTAYSNEHTYLIFVLKGEDTIVNVSNSGTVTATSTANDITTNRVAVPAGGTITLNLSNYAITSFSYTRAQYRKADSGAIYELPTNLTTYYAHQFNDYALYGVDWNSWFVATPTGLINRLLTGTVTMVKKLFGREYNTDITSISADNAVKALGNVGTYTVNSISTSTSSFNMAYCVYVPSTGTWYYLPSASTRLSNSISKISFSSSKDSPTPIDVELGNGSTWYNSTAMSYDIKNRKMTSSGLFGFIDTTTDQNWVSLPVGNTVEVEIDETTTAAAS